MKQITIQLTDHQHTKLKQLAAEKRITVETVIQCFAESCMPDGGGWTHPMKG